MGLLNRRRLRRIEAVIGNIDDTTDSLDIPAGGVGASEIADDILTAAKAAVLADQPTTGGLPVLFPITMASGADGNEAITLDEKIRVIDFWFFLKGAGTAGSTVTLDDGTNAIVTAIDCSSGGEKDAFRAAELDDAYHEIAAAGTLRATYASTGGDFPGAEGYVLAMKVA